MQSRRKYSNKNRKTENLDFPSTIGKDWKQYDGKYNDNRLLIYLQN